MNVIRYLVVLSALGFGPSYSAESETELTALVVERLSLMQPVAAWKHANDAPIEDLAREAVVLQAAQEAAAAQGIDPDSVVEFFQAQIDAAKDIQRCWILRWDQGRTDLPDSPPDLVADIRPDLLRLGDAVIAMLADALREGAPMSPAPAEVKLDCLSPSSSAAIVEALSQIRLSGR